jgi:hypothetical protein
MLFQYTYPENHSLGHLNDYLIHFVNSIQETHENSNFNLEDFFHADFVSILRESPKLLLKFEAFFDTFKSLPEASKNQFSKILSEAQDFQNVFFDTGIDCEIYKTEKIENLIGNNTFKDLADFLFSCVKYDRWDIKGHYELIYNALEYKICPFCGVHPLHKTFREDYDHLAPKAIYPLVSVNPKNLAPMCHDCNSKNKGAKDILYLPDGRRRAFIYPYTQHIEVTINFENSIIPQTNVANPEGIWNISLNPNNESTANWDRVFNIKRRYLIDFVIPNYETWLRDFVTDCIEDNIDLNEVNTIKAELQRLGTRFQRKWYDQANIIKGPLFEYLANCDNDLFYNSVRSLFNRILNPVQL